MLFKKRYPYFKHIYIFSDMIIFIKGATLQDLNKVWGKVLDKEIICVYPNI